MEAQFRKSTFGGFNRQDVVDYLEKTAKEHAALVEELQKKITQLEEDTQSISSLKEKNEELESACAKAQQESESLQAKLKGAEGEIATLRQGGKEAQEKIFALTPDAEAYRSIKDRAAGMELDAHLRAQKTIDKAEGQAKSLRDEGQQWMEQMKSQYGTARGELDLALTHAMDDVRNTKKSLETISQTMGQRDRALELLVAEWTKKLEKK